MRPKTNVVLTPHRHQYGQWNGHHCDRVRSLSGPCRPPHARTRLPRPCFRNAVFITPYFIHPSIPDSHGSTSPTAVALILCRRL